jgi:hypothetical protein
MSLIDRVRELENSIIIVDEELSKRQSSSQNSILSHLEESSQLCFQTNTDLKNNLQNLVDTKMCMLIEFSCC